MRLLKSMRDETATSAAEFALVLPLALLFFFGIIDGGRYMWTMNRLEKSVQFGTRYAVTTGIVPTGLNSYDFTGKGLTCPVTDAAGTTTNKPIVAGDTICASALGTITCTGNGTAVTCTCVNTAAGSASCPSPTIASTTATEANARFNRIVTRMQVIDPSLAPQNVTVTYSGSGLGYAKDPAVDDKGTPGTSDDTPLSDAAPIVTVSVDKTRMRTLFLLGGQIPLPGFRYSQTMEDGDGSASY